MEHDAPAAPATREYVRVLRRHWWLVLGLPVLLGVLAFAWSANQPDEWEASTLVRFRSGEDGGGDSAGGKAAASVSREVGTEVEVIATQAFRDRVTAKLDIPDDALRSVRVRARADTDVIEISVVSRRRDTALDAARTYGTLYVETVTKAEQERAQRRTAAVTLQAGALRNQLDDLNDRIEAEAGRIDAADAARLAAGQQPLRTSALLVQLESERETLAPQYRDAAAQLAALQAQAVASGASTEVISPPQRPDAPVAPRPLRAGAAGLTVGLFLGLLGVILIELLGDRLRSRSDVERFSGLPVLASVPRRSGRRSRLPVMLAEPASPTAEAYRNLRVGISFLAMRGPLDRILVTGLDRGDAHQQAAANLAVALAATGQRVGLVDCDLRGGKLHEQFGLPAAPGVTSVLLGDADLSAALHAPEVPAGALHVLTSGPLPPNPADLIALEGLERLLEEVGKEHDIVVVSAPAVLPFTDAVTLATRADGVILVATARRSRRRALADAAAKLRRVGAPALGVVLDGRGRGDDSFDPTIGELRSTRTGPV